MKEKINEIINKANELNALLILGQKAIPFLEEIFVFINDIEPLLNEINQSITDNLKKMPSATNQISKVTEATELATTEILDIMDNLSNRTSEIQYILNDNENIKNIQKKYKEEIFVLIRNKGKYNDDPDSLLSEVEKLFDLLDNENNQQMENTHKRIENILHSIDEESMKVVLNLQVQDITSQQLAAVNHLIITVQDKLLSIINKFDHYQLNEIDVSNISNTSHNIKEGSYDPNAIDSFSGEDRQNAIDEMIEKHKSKNSSILRNESNIQEDIDKLFSNHNDIKEFDNQ